jgi:phage terminase small subunit
MHEASGAFDHDPQRRRERANEPIPSGPLGDPPDFLTPPQVAIWKELEALAPPGVLTNADRIMLEMLCRLLERERHPQGSDLKAAERNQAISMLARLGMSPADRAKKQVDNPRGEDQPTDPFSQLAKRPRGRAPGEQFEQ